MTDIFEDEANQILELNSQIQLLNDLISKCKKLVGSFKHNDGLVRRLKEKQDSFNYELKVTLFQVLKIYLENKKPRKAFQHFQVFLLTVLILKGNLGIFPKKKLKKLIRVKNLVLK